MRATISAQAQDTPAAGAPSLNTWLPLLREALARDGSFRFPLHGTSMRPTLPARCTIEIAPLPPCIRLGDLIVFANGDTLIAHRLVRRQGERWIAQGDGRRSPDRPLAMDQVLGIVTAAYMDGRCCWPTSYSRLLAAFWVARHHFLRPVRLCWHGLRRVIRAGPIGRSDADKP